MSIFGKKIEPQEVVNPIIPNADDAWFIDKPQNSYDTLFGKELINGAPIEEFMATIKPVVEFVTPEIAKQYLKKNLNNRPVQSSWESRLVDAINRGEWFMTGEPIKFDYNDVLLDGQHRLHAISNAERGVWTLIVRGLQPEAFAAMDTGKTRRAADAFYMAGHRDTNALAAAVRILYLHEIGKLQNVENGSNVATSQQLLKVLDRHPGILESISYVRRQKGNARLLSRSVASFCHYIFSGIDEPLAGDFFAGLYGGAALSDVNPILALRNKLIINTRTDKKYEKRFIMAFTIKAWNAVREGKEMKDMTWSPSKESFPEII